MEQTIEQFVANHPACTVSHGTLVGEWKLSGFAEVKSLIVQLCELADNLDHHPTIAFDYNSIRVETTTHDAGNTITEKDIKFAHKTSQLAAM